LVVGAETWQEFFTAPGPSPEHTASVSKTAAIEFRHLLTRRLLGLYDDSRYKKMCSFGVGHGAIPVLDWLYMAARSIGPFFPCTVTYQILRYQRDAKACDTRERKVV